VIRAKDILESLEMVLRLDERNVANIDEIETWIRVQFIKKTPHDEVKNWLNKTLRNYMISDYQGIYQIHSAPQNSPSWLERAIERGDPVFEVDIGPSLDDFEDQILQAIETMNSLYPSRDYDKMVKSPVDVVLDKTSEYLHNRKKFEGVEETGIKYPDGCRWVKLVTTATIEHEGELLANCLKDNPGELAAKIEDRKLELWSLRTTQDKPVVHVDIQGQKVAQIAGFQNGVVPIEYRSHVYDLIERGKFTSFATVALKNIKAVYYKGKLYDEERVPNSYEMGKALIGAVTTDSYDAAQWALSHDADPNDEFEGKLPLVEAARQGFLGIVKLLLEYDADIEGRDASGQSALFAASIYAKRTIDTIEYLLKHGADPETSDGAGNTPLLLSCIHPQPELTQLMVDTGVDVNKRNNGGQTAIGLAVENGYKESFEILLDAGADIDIDVERQPLITQIISKGWASALEKMLSSGADPDARRRDGMTPLMIAAAFQQREIVKTLLKYHADPYLTDNKGQTALQHAEKSWFKAKDPQIIDIITQSMDNS
jgi:ankyrin repeat protein